MSFVFKWKDTDYTYPGKRGRVLLNDKTICEIETWAFHSCACFLLQKWNTSEIINWTKKQGTEFWEFLTAHDYSLTWYPDEIYFLISDSQKPCLRPVWRRKEVRLRDRFTNKAHGPNDVYLFRYSKAGDWKRRVINA